MTAKKNSNPFGDFTGTETGAIETAKWEFPGIGYNASQGIFYVDEDQRDSISLVPMAIRQCKEIEDINGTIHRYNVKTPKSRMIDGDVTYRLQLACIVDDTLYAFGARSWTARASFMNPRGGQWRDQNFDTGIWYLLEDWIKSAKDLHGVTTTPLCWEAELTVGGAVTVGQGKNTSKSHPIKIAGKFDFVGKERVQKYEEIFVEEDLAGWVAEWNKTTTEVMEADPEPEAIEVTEDEVPGDFAF